MLVVTPVYASKVPPNAKVAVSVVSVSVKVSCVTDIVELPDWLAVNVPEPPNAPVPCTVSVPFPTVGMAVDKAYLPSKSTVTLA